MQTPPPPPPHRRDSLQPRQQQIDQLKSEIRTKIANYQRNAILGKTLPCQNEAAFEKSDTCLLSLLDQLSLSTGLSRSPNDKPASTNSWPPSPTLAHPPDVTNRTYTVPNFEPRPKQWLPRDHLGLLREPNTGRPIGPDPTHKNYSTLGPRTPNTCLGSIPPDMK